MTEDRQLNRDSILTHLNLLIDMGVDDIVSPLVEETIFSLKQEEQASPTTSPIKPISNQTEPSKHFIDQPYQESEIINKTRMHQSSLENIFNLDQLRDFIGPCTRCKLHSSRKNLVFGVGNPNTDLMFVGEGPGADEDRQGIPFAGKAGQLLTKIIESMGFKRDDVYIANVVKCRPPQNRNPEEDEIEACKPFVLKQIELVKPKIIMCLGKFAAQEVLNTKVPITKMRGTFREHNGIPVMPSFHPAYLLRNPEAKKEMWADCKKVMAKLKELES